jgi:hypothetical protein
MSRRVAKHSIAWPKGLGHEDQVLLGIGHLVAAAATCDFFFLAVLDCLIGAKGKRHCEVIWLSQRSTYHRINMILRIAKINKLKPTILKDVEECAKLMRSISKLRNFYCHARYLNNSDIGGPIVFEGYELGSDYEDDTMDMVRVTARPIKRRSINELIAAANRAENLSLKMVRVAHQVRACTGALHVELPRLPD